MKNFPFFLYKFKTKNSDFGAFKFKYIHNVSVIYAILFHDMRKKHYLCKSFKKTIKITQYEYLL